MFLWKWFGRAKNAAVAREAEPAPAAEPRPKLGAERREHLRVPIELQVHIRFASNEALVRSRTLNLSHGGAFVVMRELRPIGTKVRLVLVVGDRTLTIGGVITHTVEDVPPQPTGVGVLFTEIADGDRTLIDELVAAQASR